MSKSEQPVEWVPIVQDSSAKTTLTQTQQPESPPESSSDESSDSSSDEELEQQLIKDIDELLCTEIKEEENGN